MHREKTWTSAYKVICKHYLGKGRKKEEKEAAKLKGKEKKETTLKKYIITSSHLYICVNYMYAFV